MTELSQEIINETVPYHRANVERAYDNLAQFEAYHAAHSKPTAPGYEVSSFNHKYTTLRGYKYHYVEEGNPEGIPLVLIHGFPDLWYGWRYQIRHLAKEGYRVIAIDNLGSGETDHPTCAKGDMDHYRSKNLCANIIALLDELKIEKAVFIGHDWGASITCKVGLHYPERCLTVIIVGIPFGQPGPDLVRIDALIPYFPQFKYYIGFRDDEPESWLGGDAHKQAQAWFNSLYGARSGTNVEEKQYYIDQFTRTTFHGSVNYYRVESENHEDERQYAGKPYLVPVLQVLVEGDTVLTPPIVESVPHDWVQTFERVRIAEGGHNVHTENPEELNKVLSEYLSKFFAKEKQQKKLEQLPSEE